MPYAKTSLRAEQRALRERMRGLGMSHRQIASEFGRRYNLRPRAAWRHAYGWSLKEAADQVNSHAARVGLDPNGTASLTGPHLCEYENWPGVGTAATGRRPTPLVLSLLAAIYGATVHDLLDFADYERMPAGDRLILEKSASAQAQAAIGSAARTPDTLARQESVSAVPQAQGPVAEGDLRSSTRPDMPLPGRVVPSLTPYPPVRHAAPIGHLLLSLAGPGGMPVLGLDEIRHLVATFEDARRYADSAVAGYFARQLAACTASDGASGPKETLPTVLAIIGAIERTVREAKPSARPALLMVGARTAEFAGWLYRDSAMPGVSSYWHDRAAEWAQLLGDQALLAYVMLKRSQVAWDERDAPRMLMLAQAVDGLPCYLPPQVRAEAAQQVARGHAMLGGDTSLIQAKLDGARGWAAEEASAGDTGRPLASHYSMRLLELQTAICYAEAGDPARAVRIYEEQLSPGSFSRRDYGYFRALAAATLAAAGRPDEAAVAGREALGIAVATASLRTLGELSRLLERLRSWPARPQVRAFHAELAGVINGDP